MLDLRSVISGTSDLLGRDLERALKIAFHNLVPVSVAWWMVAPAASNHFCFHQGDAGSIGWWVQVSSSNKWELLIFRSTTNYTGEADATPPGAVLAHYCFTWDGGFGGNNTRWYYDGVESTVTETAGSGTHNIGLHQASIGLSGFGTDQCDMGWIGVWGRVIHPGEVQVLSRRYSPLFFPNGLRHYWPLKSSGKLQHDMVGALTLNAEDGPAFALHDIEVIEPFRFPDFMSGAPVVATDPVFVRRPPIARRLG